METQIFFLQEYWKSQSTGNVSISKQIRDSNVWQSKLPPSCIQFLFSKRIQYYGMRGIISKGVECFLLQSLRNTLRTVLFLNQGQAPGWWLLQKWIWLKVAKPGRHWGYEILIWNLYHRNIRFMLEHTSIWIRSMTYRYSNSFLSDTRSIDLPLVIKWYILKNIFWKS